MNNTETFTVAELIELLEAMPQDAKVVTGFMFPVRSVRYHDFDGLSEEELVQLNMLPIA